jgi:hypothetical protein
MYNELNHNVRPRYIKIQKFVHSLENSIYNIGGPQLGFKLRPGSSVSADIQGLQEDTEKIINMHEMAEEYFAKNNI